MDMQLGLHETVTITTEQVAPLLDVELVVTGEPLDLGQQRPALDFIIPIVEGTLWNSYKS